MYTTIHEVSYSKIKLYYTPDTARVSEVNIKFRVYITTSLINSKTCVYQNDFLLPYDFYYNSDWQKNILTEHSNKLKFLIITIIFIRQIHQKIQYIIIRNKFRNLKKLEFSKISRFLRMFYSLLLGNILNIIFNRRIFEFWLLFLKN